MIINSLNPSFTSKNIIIYGYKGKNNKNNSLLFNKVRSVMNEFQTTVIYKTGENKILIPEASDKILFKLLTSDIDIFEKQGQKIVQL